MIRILGISGSLRRQSYNSALLRAATQSPPDGTVIDIATIDGIPLYNGDTEAESGIPDSVTALKNRIVQYDALLLVTPEYNNSIPGVVKNAIDWLSRPASDIKQVFGGRPVGLIGASTGGFGTILSQNAWLPVLRALGTRPWFGGKLMVSRARQVFDESGDLTDEQVRGQLQDYLREFGRFVRETAPPAH